MWLFVEEARDGIGVALVTGNGEFFKQALGKQEDMERRQDQLKKLGSCLGILGCDQKRVKALEEGKKLLASEKRPFVKK